MDEHSLLVEFIKATGLPLEAVTHLLAKLIIENGIDPQELSLEDLRNMTEQYLLDVFSDLPA